MSLEAIRVSDYVNYFRQLAISHKNIRHNPLSETGNGPAGSKRFTRWSADEVVTGLRNAVAWPALLLEIYQINTGGEYPLDIKGDYRGAFTILEHAKTEDTTDELRALSLSEKIVFDMLKQIYQHHYGEETDRDQTPFTNFHFNSLEITPISALFDNEFGYRVEFGFDFKQTININEPPEAGTFL